MQPRSKVLIIDDSVSATVLLRDLLSAEGYAVTIAHNGRDGLARAATLRPDLILLDVVMPGMSGFEVCEALRADPVLAEAPVIILTSLEDRASRLRGIEAGADDFLSKPFDAAEMLLRVKTITRLNRFRQLHAERARVDWVIGQSDEGFLLVDERDSIVFANAKARLLLDLEPEPSEIFEPFMTLARKLYQCEPEVVWASWPELPRDAPEAQLYLVRPETKNSRSCWLSLRTLEHEAGGKRTRLVRLRDVSAEMTNQRDSWSFQSMISHKLRTPMCAILFTMQILAENGKVMSSEDVEQMGLMGLDNAQRLNDEIEDILQFLDAPSLSLGGEPCPLEAIPALVAKIRAELKLDAVECIGLERVAGKRAQLPKRAMELILWRLLDNAKKFHPQQAPHILVVLLPGPPGRLTLKIVDDGVRLSPEQLQRVWRPFFQAEKDVTFEVAGMGLGLPMVASLIWNVGGRCRLANREDKPGVIVELDLPLAG